MRRRSRTAKRVIVVSLIFFVITVVLPRLPSSPLLIYFPSSSSSSCFRSSLSQIFQIVFAFIPVAFQYVNVYSVAFYIVIAIFVMIMTVYCTIFLLSHSFMFLSLFPLPPSSSGLILHRKSLKSPPGMPSVLLSPILSFFVCFSSLEGASIGERTLHRNSRVVLVYAIYLPLSFLVLILAVVFDADVYPWTSYGTPVTPPLLASLSPAGFHHVYQLQIIVLVIIIVAFFQKHLYTLDGEFFSDGSISSLRNSATQRKTLESTPSTLPSGYTTSPSHSTNTMEGVKDEELSIEPSQSSPSSSSSSSSSSSAGVIRVEGFTRHSHEESSSSFST